MQLFSLLFLKEMDRFLVEKKDENFVKFSDIFDSKETGAGKIFESEITRDTKFRTLSPTSIF